VLNHYLLFSISVYRNPNLINPIINFINVYIITFRRLTCRINTILELNFINLSYINPIEQYQKSLKDQSRKSLPVFIGVIVATSSGIVKGNNKTQGKEIVEPNKIYRIRLTILLLY